MKAPLALGVAAVVLTSGALAGAAADGSASLKFSTKKSKAATSLTAAATFAKDANGKQRVLTSITLVLPRGTKVNPKAFTLCPGDGDTIANDPGGAKHACPAGSQLGSGTVHLLLGPNETPTTFDATAWNQQAGPTLELSINGNQAYVVNSEIKGNKIVFPLGLAEQIQAETQDFSIAFDKKGTAKKPYLRTPKACTNGKWKGAVNAAVSGGSKISLPTKLSCKKH